MSHGNRVTIVGEAVHRPVGPWSAAVHRLLRHLEAVGFDAAPRYLGSDEERREIVSFVPGTVQHYPIPWACWSEDGLVAAERLLRRYHDATVDFAQRPDDVWMGGVPTDQSREVICHNDFAQYNIAFRGDLPAAIIDFDAATPGSRAWDMAYAAYRFVPLSDPAKYATFGIAGSIDVTRRLRVFVDAYDGCGLDAALILRRVAAIREATMAAIAHGGADAARLVEERHVESYDADLVYLATCVGELQRVLDA